MVRLYDGEIDEDYLRENIAEAAGLDWEHVAAADIADHFHCIVCLRAMPWDCERVYRASARYLCGDCYNQFVIAS
jgi:predicted RNA-binding Zn-ribbon protein involved in translation (DUF1610 family)